MRVVRMKYKTGVACVVILSVLSLLWIIKSKTYVRNAYGFEAQTLPTRSVDFVRIAEQQTKTGSVGRESTSKLRGRSGFLGRKVIKPPKKRVSDNNVNVDNVKVVKDAVHGDSQNGGGMVKHGKRDKKVNKHDTIKEGKVTHKATKPTKKGSSSFKIPVLVISCNRPDAVKRCVDRLIKYRPSAEQFPIIVSQDCGDPLTASAISTYGNKVKHIKQPDLTEIKVPPNMNRFRGYYKIARHYKWALSQVFDKMLYDAVLIVEDDLDIAPDFYEYFLATRSLLDTDPTIWCVSAWNDNGKAGMIDANGQRMLYRSDFFPGLGWMMKQSLWNELKSKWPAGFWDDWMRESAQRKDRVCIRPEISRTQTFGRIGVSQGQFFDEHLKHIVLNNNKVDFIHEDLSYLSKEKYDRVFLKKVSSLPIIDIQDILSQKTRGNKEVRVVYSTEMDFSSIAKYLGAMRDFKDHIPRTGYHGIVTILYKGVRVYMTPKNL